LELIAERSTADRDDRPMAAAAVHFDEGHLLLTLNDVSELVSHSHRLDETLGNICRLIKDRFRTDVCSIYVRDVDSDSLVLRATDGLRPESVGSIRMRIGEGLTGLVARTQKPVNESDAPSHPAFRYFAETGEERYHSFLGVPLVLGGVTEGVLVVQHKEPITYHRNQVSLMVGIAAQIANLVTNASLTDRLGKMVASAVDGSVPEVELSESADERATNETLAGESAGPGVSFGRAVRFEKFDFDDPKLVSRPPQSTDEEIKRYERAIAAAKHDIDSAARHLAELLGEQFGAIMQAQRIMLEDAGVDAKLRERIADGASVERAIVEIGSRYLKAFEAIDDPFMQERSFDVKDVFRRALAHARDDEATNDRIDDAVLVGHEVSLLELFSCDLSNVRGIAVERGGTHGHVAILARSLRIPMLTHVAGLLKKVRERDELIVDGDLSRLVVRPDRSTRIEWSIDRSTDAKNLASLDPSIPLRLETTVNLLPEVERTVRFGGAGIGLYRSEFLELARRAFPTEEEQVEVYRRMLEMLDGRPVTVRTMDLRSEKKMYGGGTGMRRYECWEWRLVDRLPHVQDVIRSQLRAIIRSSAFGPIRALFPMITSRRQLDSALRLFHEAETQLRDEGFEFIRRVPLGMMVETPGSARLLPHFIDDVDFVSIGSNDLLHFLLGIERCEDELTPLKSPLDPAFLFAVRRVVKVAHAASKTVTVCGEAAGHPQAAIALALLGVDVLSIPPDQLNQIRSAFAESTLLNSTDEQAFRADRDDWKEIGDRLVRAVDADEVSATLARFTSNVRAAELY
jgi:phosphotransferase system enzyme I (PtsP)